MWVPSRRVIGGGGLCQGGVKACAMGLWRQLCGGLCASHVSQNWYMISSKNVMARERCRSPPYGGSLLVLLLHFPFRHVPASIISSGGEGLREIDREID